MGTKCAEKTIYSSLEYCKGSTILPGIRYTVYFSPKSDIVTWPKLGNVDDETSKTMEDLAKYTGNFVLASDKKWRKIECLTTDSKISSESQGEKPSKTFINKATIKFAGQDEDVTGFCRQANADDFVYLIQQRNGKFRVIGNEMFETETKPKQDSGSSVTDKAGTEIEIECTDICPAPFYPGEIVAEDGTILGKDGSIKPGE